MKNIEQSTEPLENSDLKHLYLFFYLIPILGFFPSLWTLYRGTRGLGLGTGEMGEMGELGEQKEAGDKKDKTIHNSQLLLPQPPQPPQLPQLSSSHQPTGSTSPSLAVSRLSVTLAFAWLLGYLLLNVGAETSEFLTLRLLVLNSFLTSGYFLVSIWLMVRLAMRKSVRLPGFTTLAQRVIGKHLS